MDYRKNLNKLTVHMAQLKKARMVLQKDYNDTRDKLYHVMTRRKLHKYSNAKYTISVTKGGTYHSFSSRLLKKYDPKVYKNPKFHQTRVRKGSIRIKANL